MEMAQQTSEKAQFGDGNGGSHSCSRAAPGLDPGGGWARPATAPTGRPGSPAESALADHSDGTILVEGLQHVFHAPRLVALRRTRGAASL